MDYFYAICKLCAGLGVFLLGVKLLSENMEKLANRKLKGLFKKTSNNKLTGVGIGAFSTAIVQSSGLTTVMVIGFVNSGIMELGQATSFIMGANIGTTITAQLAALQSFSFSDIAIAITLIGVFINMFSKKDKKQSLGLALAGVGLVFIGLDLMTGAMEIFKQSDNITQLFTVIKNPILLFFVGVILTALVQSSSVVTTIVIAMCSAGITIGNGGNSPLFVILGSNVGSCFTAIISSLGSSSNAKRTALIHFLFNFLGSVLFIVLLIAYKNFMVDTFNKWFIMPATQIAMFHTFFNFVCTILFLPFSNLFVRCSKWIIKDKTNDKVKKVNLDKRFLSTPTVAIEQTNTQLFVMAEYAVENLKSALNFFIERQNEENEIIKNTNEIGEISKEITNYLIKVSASELTFNDEKRISILYSNNGDIMRITEIADNIAKYTKRQVEDDLIFSNEVLVQLKEMMEILDNMFSISKQVVLNKNFDLLNELDKIEENLDKMRSVLINSHIERLKVGACRPENSSIFINLVSNLERAGDHITYIAHSFDSLK